MAEARHLPDVHELRERGVERGGAGWSGVSLVLPGYMGYLIALCSPSGALQALLAVCPTRMVGST